MSSPVEKNVYWEIVFPNAPDFSMLFLNAEVHQSENSHDYLILEYKGALDNHTKAFIQSDDPVIFNWGDGNHSAQFIGFIHTIEKVTTLNNVYTRIRCINNSSKFKRSGKKVYKNMTANQIVESIARYHGFHPKTSFHPLIHKNLVQSGNSDWQTLKHLSMITGYALRANNTSMIFKKKDQLIQETFKTMPVFTHFMNAPKGLISHQTLLSFTALDSTPMHEYGTQGDKGVIVHNNSGRKHAFTPKRNVDNGQHSHQSFNVPTNWNNDYGVN